MRPIALVFLILFAISACATRPTPVSHPYSSQKKIEVAHHWDIIAENVASQIKVSLEKAGLMTRYVFVTSNDYATEFNEGFKDMLTTHLVKQGVTTLAEKSLAYLAVEYKAQVLFHKSGKLSYVPSPKTGALAVLGAGIIAITDAILSEASKTDLVLAIGGTALGWSALDEATARAFTSGQPMSEVIITTSVVEQGIYVMRKTDVYYIVDQDFWHYRAPLHAKNIKIVD